MRQKAGRHSVISRNEVAHVARPPLSLLWILGRVLRLRVQQLHRQLARVLELRRERIFFQSYMGLFFVIKGFEDFFFKDENYNESSLYIPLFFFK